MKTVHLGKQIRFRMIAACGLWAIDTTTQNPKEVTCKACQKTILFREKSVAHVISKG